MGETVQIELPKTKLAVETKSPNTLVLYGPPKVGKTTILSQLDDCLLLDLEEGSMYVEAMKIRAKTIEEITAIGREVIKQGRPYKYVAVDTITALEDLCMPYALKLYKQTPMGANFTGTNVLALPRGLGYTFLWEAYTRAVSYIKTWAPKLILIGHLKESSIEKDGKEVAMLDLQLTGKLKFITCGEMADAIGYMYRQGSDTFINFNSSETVLCGSRSEHLRGKTIKIAESNEGNIIKTHWNEIYND